MTATEEVMSRAVPAGPVTVGSVTVGSVTVGSVGASGYLTDPRSDAVSPSKPAPVRRSGRRGSRAARPQLGRPPDLGKVQLPQPVGPFRRAWKHPALRPYNRLVAAVLAVNLLILGHALTAGHWWSDDRTALTLTSRAALVNIATAILFRQQHVINILFWLATRAPTWWPLTIRWSLAKIYHFGGLHFGGSVAGTLWFVGYAATVIRAWAHGSGTVTLPTVALVGALSVLLCGIVLASLPPLRARRHDRFELTHRYGGWTALLLFWLLTLQGVRDTLAAASPGAGGTLGPSALLGSGRVWVLTLVTASVALPWLRLRRVPVEIDRPSSHVALVRLRKTKSPFAGSSTAISRNPFLDWHAFANIPEPDRISFRMAVSRAGDWTGQLIDDPPRAVWIRGVTTAGVANVERLFTKVAYVATGSGIGPVLPHLLASEVPSHLAWATKSPHETYGDELVREILQARPDARIWDTKLHGKPDMLALAYLAYQESGAEAVICISNPSLTWQVVHGLERLGIPAFGAIWDS